MTDLPTRELFADIADDISQTGGDMAVAAYSAALTRIEELEKAATNYRISYENYYHDRAAVAEKRLHWPEDDWRGLDQKAQAAEQEMVRLRGAIVDAVSEWMTPLGFGSLPSLPRGMAMLRCRKMA